MIINYPVAFLHMEIQINPIHIKVVQILSLVEIHSRIIVSLNKNGRMVDGNLLIEKIMLAVKRLRKMTLKGYDFDLSEVQY